MLLVSLKNHVTEIYLIDHKRSNFFQACIDEPTFILQEKTV